MINEGQSQPMRALSNHLYIKNKSVFQQNNLMFWCLNPSPHIPILGSSNSEASQNTMSKLWTNGVQLSD